jgi:hypothetical protein
MDWTRPLADIDGLAAWVAKDSPQRAALWWSAFADD